MPTQEQAPPQPPINTESRLVAREAWQEDIAITKGIGSVALSNFQEPLTIRNLPDEYSERESAILDVILDSQSPEDVAAMETHLGNVQRDVAGEDTVYDGSSFLAEDADETPLVDMHSVFMADPKVQEVLDRRDMGEAHTRLLEAWPQFKEEYSQGIARGVEMGYIPAAAEQRASAAMEVTSVRIADSAVIDVISFGTLAYYENKRDEIGVRHDDVATEKAIVKHLAHEFTHKISGGTFTLSAGENSGATRSRVGFGAESKPDVYSRTGLNEAMTEHVTQGILTGDFETVDPDKRNDETGTYHEYRKVLAAFVDSSQGAIDMKSFIGAYFEDTGTGGGTESRRQLVKEVKQAYGLGALTKLEKLMDLSMLVPGARLEDVVISRIYPPECDEQGRVIRQGYIDTKDMPTPQELFEMSPLGQSIMRDNSDALVSAEAAGNQYNA